MSYPPFDPNPTPSLGGSPITGTDYNQLLNLVVSGSTKSGSLTLSQGSSIILQSGSINANSFFGNLNGIPILSPYNYLVFYSGSYLAVDMANNKIISSHPNDLAVVLNTAIKQAAISATPFSTNSIKVLPNRIASTAVGNGSGQQYYMIHSPIDFSPLYNLNGSETTTFVFDARGTKIQANNAMNMMVNLSSLLSGSFTVADGVGQFICGQIYFGALFCNNSSGPVATYGVFIRSCSECTFSFDYIQNAVNDGIFFESSTGSTGNPPTFGCYSNKLYCANIAGSGRDGLRMAGLPVLNVIGIQSTKIDLPFIPNSGNNAITIGPNGVDNCNLNEFTVRAYGGSPGGIVDNSGGNWWKLPGGQATVPFIVLTGSNGTTPLPCIVDVLQQGGRSSPGLGLPHRVRGLMNTQTGPPWGFTEDIATWTGSGNGSNKIFTVSTQLYTDPTVVNVTPASPAATGSYYISLPGGGFGQFQIIFSKAPPNGANNLVFHYRATV
jgi:hypothetical protein